MNHRWIEKFIYKTYVHISNIVRKRCTIAVPATPANVNATKLGSNGGNVTWDNVAGETGFNIYRSADDVNYYQVGTVAADVLLYSTWRLDPNTLYYFKVSAFNVDGESALSAADSFTTDVYDEKFLYLHNLGPFTYDGNSYYERSSLGRYAFYTDGSISIGDNLSIGGDISVLTGVVYHGTGEANWGGAVEGAWRIKVIGTDMVFQRYESSAWVTKGNFTP